MDYIDYVTGPLFILAGLAGMSPVIYQYWLVAKTKWKRTLGKVKTSYMKKRIDNDLNSTSYEAVIEYEYAVNGETFLGDKIYPGSKFATSAEMTIAQIVKKYPKGKNVSVYYKKKDPALACLEIKMSPIIYIALFVSCVICLVGFGIIFSIYQRYQ